ncbi:MAG: helix-turn-helix transcriptional regulator [Candidatus Gastranaerophilaceae bacterium]
MIKNRLSIIMGIKRLKIAELSQMTGLNYNTISNLYYNKTKGVDFETLNKICWALECNTQELFQYSD